MASPVGEPEASEAPPDASSEEPVNQVVADSPSGAPAEGGHASMEESREDMLARHRKETKDLQAKEMLLKKNAARGSRAEQKAKKKEVDEEVARLDRKMKGRQAKELSALGFAGEPTPDGGPKPTKKETETEALVRALAGVTTGVSGAHEARPTKAQARRDKKLREEAEREQRIRSEKAGVVSHKALEDRQLAAKLAPAGLAVREVKPDGHCLYRAVEDQLALPDGGDGGGGDDGAGLDFWRLRAKTAEYMRSHPGEFMPFVAQEQADGPEEGEEEDEEGADPAARFERYCKEVETTAAWGGQLELGALAHALRRHITVVSADLPDVEMGGEYRERGGRPPVRVSYHRHAFGLGEHYNSVVPAAAAAAAAQSG